MRLTHEKRTVIFDVALKSACYDLLQAYINLTKGLDNEKILCELFPTEAARLQLPERAEYLNEIFNSHHQTCHNPSLYTSNELALNLGGQLRDLLKNPNRGEPRYFLSQTRRVITAVCEGIGLIREGSFTTAPELYSLLASHQSQPMEINPIDAIGIMSEVMAKEYIALDQALDVSEFSSPALINFPSVAHTHWHHYRKKPVSINPVFWARVGRQEEAKKLLAAIDNYLVLSDAMMDLLESSTTVEAVVRALPQLKTMLPEGYLEATKAKAAPKLDDEQKKKLAIGLVKQRLQDN